MTCRLIAGETDRVQKEVVVIRHPSGKLNKVPFA